MSDCIAVINAGSSSVKFAIYAPGEVIALYRGQIEGIGTTPRLRIVNAKGEAIAHRVVHGGRSYAAPTRVTRTLLDDLAKLIPLAPLHQPHNLAPIRAVMAAAPSIPQVACF